MPHLVWDETEIQQGPPRLKRADEPRQTLPYRLLVEDESQRVQGAAGENDNLLIQGDNLEALQSLLPYYAGQVKCIFIDPPYNTGSAFTHYDDGIEHSAWLSMMLPRLKLLREFLRPDGSIWVTIDDHEAHYLKVLMDQVFGRANFIANLAWHKRVSPANDAKFFSSDFDHILVYAKTKAEWTPKRLAKNEAQLANYRNPDNDPRGVWNSSAYTCAKTADERPNLYYAIRQPNSGEDIWPSRTRVWAYDSSTHQRNVEAGLLYWGIDGLSSKPRIKKFLTGSKPVVPRSIWSYEDAGHNQESRLEIDKLFAGDPFTTPKPEKLLKRIFEIATNPGDLILDSFLGSGTTAAVAHKMGRRWIGIEMGAHARTHCLPRMQKVVAGEQGGISQAVNWQGGGGFRYLTLGAPIRDAQGHINPAVRFNQLAAHLWFAETGTPWPGQPQKSPLIGVHHDAGKNQHTAYALFYNGVWGEDCPDNTLSPARLARLKARLPDFDGGWVIYAHFVKQLSDARLTREGVRFCQLPHGVVGAGR